MMKKLGIATWATAVLALVGCQEEKGPPFVIRDSTGVAIVENDHTQPAWSSTNRWSLATQPRLQMGNVPGDFNQQLYRVAHSTRLSSGAIAVANTGLGDVRLFDDQGYHIRTMRVTAVDAENAVAPVRVEELYGDSLLVFLTDRSIAVFDNEGRLARRTRPLATDVPSDPGPEMLGILDDGSLVLRVHPPQDTTGTGIATTEVELLRYRSDGSPLSSIGRFQNLTVLRGDDALVFAPVGKQALGDSTIWFGTGSGYELHEVRIDGSTRRIVRLDRPPNQVTTADTLAYRQAAVNTLSQRDGVEESAAERLAATYRFPETFPTYSDMIVDRLGNIWLKGYHWYDMGAPVRWSVFDAEGRFLGDMDIPALMEVHDIGDGYMIGRMAADRAEAVYLYELNKPPVTRLSQAVP